MSDARRARLLDGPVLPTLAALAAPNIAASFLQSGMAVVEGAYLGRLGTVELAGVALVFPLLMLTNMLSGGAIGGVVAGATARALGAGDDARAREILRAAVLIALALAAVMAFVILGFGRSLYRILGGDGAVLEAADLYGDRLASGIVTLWLFNVLASLLRGSGDTVRPAIALGCVLCLHAVIAWVLIFPLGMGIAGAGVAMPLAYLVGAVGLSAWLLGGRAAVSVSLGPVSASVLVPLLRQGVLAATQSLLTVAMALIVTAIIGRLGTHWLAGYGIGARLEFLMIPVIFGVGGALIAMVGVNVGAGRRRRAIRIAWTGGAMAACIVGGIGMIGAVQPDLWGRLFTDDPATLEAVGLYLSIVGPFYAFFGLGLCLYFASQGLGSMVWPVVGTLLRLLIVLGGGLALLATDAATPSAVFSVVAGAMAFYGLFIVAALRLGPWRT
ncbi:MAG: MATE family efflux transporter [Thalassobaculaceae bacterium]